jgi:hypothetical protein
VTDVSGSTPQERDIARAILRYLRAHPEAKDTMDGIAEWWLEGRHSERRVVERAIGLLLSHGAVLETRRRGLPPYYQANPQAPPDAAALLDRSDAGAGRPPSTRD